MSHKSQEPEVYFPSDPAGRDAMVLAIDNVLGDKPQVPIKRRAVPRKVDKKKTEKNTLEL